MSRASLAIFVLASLALVHCSSDSTSTASAPSPEGGVGGTVSAGTGGAPLGAAGSGNGGAKGSGGKGSGGSSSVPDARAEGGAQANDSGLSDSSAGGLVGSGGAGSGGAAAGGTAGAGGAGTGGAAAGGVTGSGGAAAGGAKGSGGAGTGGASGSGGAAAGGASGSGGAAAGGATGSGGAPTVIPSGAVRFANVSPDSPELEVCIKRTADATYTAERVFKAHGANKNVGLGYGQITNYLDLGLDSSEYYDLLFVGAATGNCSPPFYGFIGTRGFPAAATTTVAHFEYFFAPPGYNAAQIQDAGTVTAGQANVRLFHASQAAPTSADFYGKPSAGAESLWFSAVGEQTGTPFHATAPGTYDIRATQAGTLTTLAQKTGLALTAAAPLDLFLFHTDATNHGLMRCPATQATLFAACAP